MLSLFLITHTQIFQKAKAHLKILGTKTASHMKQVPFEVPQICSALVQNLVSVLIGIWDLCTPDFNHILRFVDLIFWIRIV